MSAIFGLVNLDGRPALEADIERMSKALSAYGADGGWNWCRGEIGLGQQWTWFTPEDRFERPPRNGEDYIVVFDGRIDNRPELTEELGIPLHEEKCLPDSAFILKAYSKWGEECAAHLLGGFAFGLYDIQERKVLLARSPMGERSLFFYEKPGLFAFSSAPKGIFALPFVNRKANLQTVADFIAHMPSEPGSSFFAGIHRIQPGHMVVVSRRGLQSKRFNRLQIDTQKRFRRDSDYVEAFTALLDRVISDQLRSSSGAGVLMSGGLDSSSIAAHAAVALGKEGRRLHTFTEVPPPDFRGSVPKGRYADETPYVQAMARMYSNLEAHFVHSKGDLYLNNLNQFVNAGEAPMRNASNWPWLEAIYREASLENVRILMTGTVGNLTISWAGDNLISDLLRRGHWRASLAEAQSLASREGRSSVRVFAGRGILPLLPDPLWRVASRVRERGMGYGSRPAWMAMSPIRVEFALSQHVEARARQKGDDFRQRSSPEHRASFLIRQAEHRADARRTKEVLFGVLQVDPPADSRIVEFSLSVPEGQFLRGGESRWLIRRAMADRLPVEILQNRKRGLQAANWALSMRQALPRMKEILGLLHRSSLAAEVIDLNRIRALLDGIQDVEGSSKRGVVGSRTVLESGLSTGYFLAWIEGLT